MDYPIFLAREDNIVRFTLRTFFVAVLLFALALSTIISALKLKQARRDLVQIRETHGVGVADCIELLTIGSFRSENNDPLGSHLIRLDNPLDYTLEAVFYDGTTLETKRETVELTDPQFSISYSFFPSDPSQDMFYIQQTTVYGSAHVFCVDGEDSVTCAKLRGGPIDGNPFLIYLFRTSLSLNGPMHYKVDEVTAEALLELCERYKVKGAYFRLVRRP